MNQRIFLLIAFFLFFLFGASAQKIVVDTTSSAKYLITKKNKGAKAEATVESTEPSFGDRALSIGKGIVNRLKARLNLEEAAESIKEKKERLVGKEQEEGGG